MYGIQNIRIGNDAGLNLNVALAQQNTLIGDGAGKEITVAASHVALGVRALAAEVEHDGKVAIGTEALYRCIADSQNTGVGYQAAFFNTLGKNLVAIGSGALYWNTLADNNVSVGGMGNSGLDNNGDGLAGDLVGGYNASIGWDSLCFLTSGTHNWAGGTSAAFCLRDGSHNTNCGTGAGYHNVSGNGQVNLGNYAGFWETQSNKLFIDNQQRASEADARLKALIYGIFDAAVANQRLTVNGDLNVATKFGLVTAPSAPRPHVTDAEAGTVVEKVNAILATLEAFGFHLSA